MSLETETTTAAETTDTTAAAAATQQQDATASQAETTAATTETAAAAETQPTWRDDWREQIVAKLPAAEREKELTRLKRIQSPENLYRNTRELEKKLSSGQFKATLPEGATEAEVAEYRKANNIPDEPSAEKYGITFPQGYEPNDADKADVSDFLADMHKDNVPPAVVQKVWNKYIGIKEKAEQQLYEAAQQATIDYKAELKAEFGRDFDRNVRLGNAHLVQAVGEDQAKGFMAMTLADGTKLGDNPAFVRYIVAQALATADDAALATSESGDTGKSVDGLYKAALDLKFTDSKRYHTPEHQAKLQKLAAARAGKKAA